MAITSGYFNSVNGDRKYNADQMSEYFEGIINEGVCQHIGGGLAVTAGTGLTVSVATGKAFIGQKWIKNDAALTLTITTAADQARIDAVVLRRNTTNRVCEIAVKTGTPSASPSAPAMTRNATTYEMALAYVNVAAGATSVTVTDKRADTTVCGWATVAQATSGEVDAQLNALKTGFDGVVYDSPVEMVTSCDQKLDDEISDLDNGKFQLSYELEQGMIQADGSETENNKAMRTIGFIARSEVDSCTFNERTGTIYIAYYDTDKNIKARTAFKASQTAVLSTTYPYFRLAFYENITPPRTAAEFQAWVSLKKKSNIQKQIDELSELIPLSPTVISVGQGTGFDFNSLYEAVNSINNSGPNNRFIIELNEGTYDILEEMGGADVVPTTSVGIILPDYVDLIGIGNRDNIIISAVISQNQSNRTRSTYFSAMNLKYNNTIKNITFVAKNSRYPVHDESNGLYTDYVRIVENCVFHHYGAEDKDNFWTSCHGYGLGTSSGSKLYFKRCHFITNESTAGASAFACHNSANSDLPTCLEFEDCKFENTGTYLAFSIGSLQTGTKDYAILKGCNFCGKDIVVKEQVRNSGTGITFVPEGYANRGFDTGEYAKRISDSTGQYTEVEVY